MVRVGHDRRYRWTNHEQRSNLIKTLKDQACIVGVGESAFTRGSEKTVLRLVLEASRHAIADAGLTPQDIDGFVLSGSLYLPGGARRQSGH